MVIVACVVGVKRGRGSGNLGAKSNIVISTRQSSDFYRLITEIGENRLSNLLCQIDIIDIS